MEASVDGMAPDKVLAFRISLWFASALASCQLCDFNKVINLDRPQFLHPHHGNNNYYISGFAMRNREWAL